MQSSPPICVPHPAWNRDCLLSILELSKMLSARPQPGPPGAAFCNNSLPLYGILWRSRPEPQL